MLTRLGASAIAVLLGLQALAQIGGSVLALRAGPSSFDVALAASTCRGGIAALKRAQRQKS
jgi:hypothetical protein